MCASSVKATSCCLRCQMREAKQSNKLLLRLPDAEIHGTPSPMKGFVKTQTIRTGPFSSAIYATTSMIILTTRLWYLWCTANSRKARKSPPLSMREHAKEGVVHPMDTTKKCSERSPTSSFNKYSMPAEHWICSMKAKTMAAVLKPIQR